MLELGGGEDGLDEGVAGGEVGDGAECGGRVETDGGGGREGWEEGGGEEDGNEVVGEAHYAFDSLCGSLFLLLLLQRCEFEVF